MGCRSGVYATAVVEAGVDVAGAVDEGGVVAVETVVVEAAAGVQVEASDGPSGTPFEQAATTSAGNRNVHNRTRVRFMAFYG